MIKFLQKHAFRKDIVRIYIRRLSTIPPTKDEAKNQFRLNFVRNRFIRSFVWNSKRYVVAYNGYGMEEGKTHALHWLGWCVLFWRERYTMKHPDRKHALENRPLDRHDKEDEPKSGVKSEVPKMETLLNNVYWPPTIFMVQCLTRETFHPRAIRHPCSDTTAHTNTHTYMFPFSSLTSACSF